MQTLALLFLLLAWLTDLHIGPWVSWHNELWVFVAVCCAAIGVLTNNKAQAYKGIPVPYAALAVLILGLVVIFQFCAGRIDFHGDVVVMWLYFGLVFWAVSWGFHVGSHEGVASQSWSDQNVVTQLACTMLLGAVASTFVAGVQTLDVWQDVEWIARGYGLRRPGGNINQPNQLATLQLMGIASLAYLYERRTLRGFVALLLFGVLIAGVGLTESRTGVVSAVAMSSYFLVYRKRYLGTRAALLVACGLLWLVLCFKFLPLGSHYLQNLGQAGAYSPTADISAGSRLLIWPQLIEASLQHPWLGWGLRQVPMAHNAVLHAYPVGEAFTYAHSIILDLILGLGYPLALVCVVLVSVWASKRIFFISDVWSWYCMALVIPFGVHSLFEFPFAYAYFLLPVGLAIGVLEARQAPQSVIRVHWKLVATATTVMTGLMVWSAWEYVQIEEDFRVARFEAVRIGKTPVSYDRPHLILFDQMDAMLSVIRLVPTPSMDTETIDISRRVALRFPWIATQNRYALILALNGNAQESVRQLKVLRAMHGERTYAGIKAAWHELGEKKYPQLLNFPMP